MPVVEVMFTVGYDELAVAIWVSTGGMGDVGECTDDETWRRERPRFRLRLDLNSSDGIASGQRRLTVATFVTGS